MLIFDIIGYSFCNLIHEYSIKFTIKVLVIISLIVFIFLVIDYNCGNLITICKQFCYYYPNIFTVTVLYTDNTVNRLRVE